MRPPAWSTAGTALWIAILNTFAAPGAPAQEPGDLARRLPPALAATVQAQLDSARIFGIPAAPLVRKALEGVARAAPDPLVIAAVRSLRLRMEQAAGILIGPDEDQLVAAADALFAGIDDQGLRELAAAVPPRSLLTTLTVFTDLVRRGVTVDAASGTVVALAHAGVGEDGLTRFRLSVLADIADGVDPAAAVRNRARTYIRPPSPDEPSTAAWSSTSPLRPASGSAQLGLGLHADTPLGSDGVAGVSARGWVGTSSPGAAPGQAVPVFEIATWGAVDGTGWYGRYGRHDIKGFRFTFSEAALGAFATVGGTRLRATGTALWSGRDGEGVRGGSLDASVGRALGPVALELLLRGGGSLDASRVGRDTVFHVGPHAFRSERSRLVERSQYYGDVGFLAQVRVGPLSALASAGHRIAPGQVERGPWLDASATLDVAPRASLELRGGWARPDPWGVRAGGSWLQAGVEVRVWGPDVRDHDRAGPQPQSLDGIETVMHPACSAAGTEWGVPDLGEGQMEWMGDPSGWNPEPMVRKGGRWVAEQAFAQGRHRLLVRADGHDWAPPPELPVVLDELGAAGLLVVDSCAPDR